MTQDEQYLDLLGIFHYVLAIIVALLSCMPIFHVVIGVLIVTGHLGPQEAPTSIVGLMFIIIPSIFVLVGWIVAMLLAVCGSRLRQRRSYTFCLVVAAVECAFAPFGTVLGVFTIVTLNKEPVKRLFNAQLLQSTV